MEQAISFALGGDTLIGVLHPGAAHAGTGVLIVVGGPQYRVGSHRQFVLLARHLAGQGIPVFRFDYRGMGDASGEPRDFIHCGADLKAALDVFVQRCPDLDAVVLWGLCDAASAALLHLTDDPRVGGLVLVNPWVRSEQGLARARLKAYYLRRLVSRDFWSGLLRGRRNPLARAAGLLGTLRRLRAPRQAKPEHSNPELPFPLRMAQGWGRFSGPILLVISGNDLTAAEFLDTAGRDPHWRGLLERANVTRRFYPEANHTFSRAQWREQLARETVDWVRTHALRGRVQASSVQPSAPHRG